MGAATGHRRTRIAIVVALIVIVAVGSGLFVACRSTGGSGGRVTGSLGPVSTSTTRPPIAGETVVTPIEWSSCEGGECGRLEVPLDGSLAPAPIDSAGGGETIELALFRAAARDPDRRIGSLLVNPGGPGASGIELARSSTRFLPDSVSERFDVIGWDPRGVGASAGVDCGERLDYLFSGDTSPDDTAEWDALDDVSRRFAAECGARSGAELLSSVSTRATVHDMERIRLALGEEQISFLGFSYGTELGALYATLYPDRVRAMVLDGAVDPSLSAAEAVIQQAEGLERGLEEFFAAREVKPFLDKKANRLLEEELEFQAQHRFADLPRGPVHADLFRDNALFEKGRISGVVDFYFAGVECLLYDAAVCANDWCLAEPQADRRLDEARTRALLAACHAIRPFNELERKAWPAMLRAAALRFWLSRLYDFHLPRPGMLVHAHDPDHFRDILELRVQAQPIWVD